MKILKSLDTNAECSGKKDKCILTVVWGSLQSFLCVDSDS